MMDRQLKVMNFKGRMFDPAVLVTGLFLTVFSSLFPEVSHAKSSIRWGAGELSVTMGSARVDNGTLVVTTNRYGKAFISIPTGDYDLAAYPHVIIEFWEPPSFNSLLLIWGSGTATGEHQQIKLPSGDGKSIVLSMQNVPAWHGHVKMLGLGVQAQPGKGLIIKSISIEAPSAVNWLRSRLADWLYYRPWQAIDINLHTGTKEFNKGTTPVVFATLALGGLLIFPVFAMSMSKRYRAIRWKAVGLVVLVCWIFTDMLWQVRLLRQNSDTVETFAGKTSSEKLLLTPDRNYVKLARHVKSQVPELDGARLFLASARDDSGMATAYYMAPVNTYWHRKGPELPDAKWLKSGDFILLVRPYEANYNQRIRMLRAPGGDLSVEQLVEDPMGLLLRVK